MTTQIVILAAGKGTRMASTVPKVLNPLDDKPVIEYLLAEVKKVPQNTLPIVVVGFQHDVVREALGGDYLYALQEEQKGTGHAVQCAKPLVTAQNILVLYGDMPFVTAASMNKLIALHESNNAKVSMFTGMVPNFDGLYDNFLAFGRIIRSGTNDIIKIQEYIDCSDDEKRICEINPGIYMFSTAWLWEHMEEIGHNNKQGEFYLTDIVEIAIRNGQAVVSLPIAPEEIFGINTPDQLAHAHSLINI